jgi:hypothetical protein
MIGVLTQIANQDPVPGIAGERRIAPHRRLRDDMTRLIVHGMIGVQG